MDEHPDAELITATFHVRHEYRPINEMLHGSWSLRDSATRDPVGAHWKCMGSLVLLAFAVEAFVQTVGPAVFATDWLQGRRYERAGYRETLPKIGQRAGVSVDFTKDPWSSIDRLFKARHGLAHPKPGVREFEKPATYPRNADPRDIAYALAAESWEPLISEVALADVDADVRRAIEVLADGLGINREDVYESGIRSYSAKFEPGA